jgi:DNA-3-methyladenine glycosylase II
MIPIASPKELRRAADYLAKHDPLLAPVIARAGICTILPHRNYYWALIDSIISQQLSVKAAASIEKRFKELFGSELPEPAVILETTIDELRSAGLSGAKARYIQDLARHIVEGSITFDKFDSSSNEDIRSELTAVKGIGDWTADMFLIFCMGRLDVLATGDLAIRNGARALYDFPDSPTPAQVREVAVANNWHPYESVACWYIWRSLEALPAI